MKFYFFEIIFILTMIALLPLSMRAAACPSGTLCIDSPVKWNDLEQLINALIDFVFYLTVIILPGVIMYGGIRMVISRGDPKEFEEGKKILIWAGIGFVIMLLAKGMVKFIADIFLK